VGVDLGGTKIEAAVLRLGARDDAPPEVLAKKRIGTQRERGYDHIVDATTVLIAEVTRDAGLAAPPPIGVGMPGSRTFRAPDGTRSADALVKNSNTTCLNGRPFFRDLTARVGSPILFENDANCFALAEIVYGAARGARVAFGVILGTGVGGGVAFGAGEGRGAWTWAGAQGIAGEWGHVVLEPERGPACYCGKRGCVETFLAGPALEQRYAASAHETRPLAEIAARAESDAAAKATLAFAAETFGRALATVLDVLDPDVVVLGGGASNLDVWTTAGREAAERWVFNDELGTRIVRHAIGDSAGLWGAALLHGKRP
jgi:fructokinase